MTALTAPSVERPVKAVKLIVFDLDNTVWEGTLLEDTHVRLKPEIAAAIPELDRRGILMSVASRNDHGLAMAKLREFGLAEYFLHPQINWGTKSDSLRSIAEQLNIGLDAVAFVDDEPFERDEVAFALPQVRTVDSRLAGDLLKSPDFNPAAITADARRRREMYLADMRRNEDERATSMPKEAFLAGLNMCFTIAKATQDDLLRAEELTLRTNQLNTTGRTYGLAELEAMCRSPDHMVLMARLEDRYGPYGTIGLAVVDLSSHAWSIRLLLMSCRVMSRGVGSILMNYIRSRAREAGVALEADFVSNGRNRMMYATYKFSGFSEVERDGDRTRLLCDLSLPADYPSYVALTLPEGSR